MQKLNKKQVAEIYKKCLNLIRRKPSDFLVFKKLGICGWCLYEQDILLIDHRKDLLRTAYHECIHYLYPEWSETMVIYAESRVINQSTILDNARFLKYLSVKVYKSALSSFLTAKRKKKSKRKNKNVP